MTKPLRILIIEDSEDDTLLLLRELRRGGYEPVSERIETPESMKAALEKGPWDIIISDYVLPGFSGLTALNILKESGHRTFRSSSYRATSARISQWER